LKSTFWQRVALLPPVACRLLARKRWGRVLDSDEIAKAAGITAWQVERLAEQTNWDEVPIAMFKRFTVACGVDFFDERAMARVRYHLRYQRRNRFEYLRRSADWETYYKPLLKRWKESLCARSS
jgi:hypothetical protein